jgi:hypothetical protein
MERQGATITVASMRNALDECTRRQARLIEAVEIGGDIPSLTVRLRDVGGEIKRIQDAIEAYRPLKIEERLVATKDYVTKACRGFGSLLLSRLLPVSLAPKPPWRSTSGSSS